MDERRTLRLTLTLKSINTDNSIDIEYSCDRESEQWRTQSDTVIKTRMISAIKPNTRNIKLGADPEIVHFPMSLYSLEFSAYEKISLVEFSAGKTKSLNDK